MAIVIVFVYFSSKKLTELLEKISIEANTLGRAFDSFTYDVMPGN